MNFQESIEYLYGLGNEVLAMKLGLENISRLLSVIGNPRDKFLKAQIAGTNGKGSTCAFLEAICLSAGIKVGMNTSPHLISITERIKIGGREISEEDFAKHATKIRDVSEELVKKGELETVPTFFEQLTAIALNAFAEAEIELAILETGLGGRFDATTAANAQIVAITPIDYDHQKILGDTLEEIAAEKAAIIRKDTKTIIAAQREEPLNTILEQCNKLDVLPKFTTNSKATIERKSNKNFIVDFQTEKAAYENVRLSLLGKHQIENAKTAILLAEALQEYFEITVENIIEGLETATHKGRLEFNKNFLFDGAHNIAGAKALKEFLDEFITAPITIIFGAMRDKDIEEIAAILLPKATNIILTEVDNPRSLDITDWRKIISTESFNGKVFYTATVGDAILTAKKISTGNELICVTGSLYLIGEAQKFIDESIL